MNKGVLGVGLALTTPLLGLLLVNIHRDPTAISSPLINRPAPDLHLNELGGGGSLSLASLRGRGAVVNFWATWCVPCIEEHASLTAGAKANPDIAFLGVVYEDTAENARMFLDRRGAAYASYSDEDGKAAMAFGVYGVPETFFIDAQGIIVDKFVGPLSPDLLREKLRVIQK